jgi:hypothetical protein
MQFCRNVNGKWLIEYRLVFRRVSYGKWRRIYGPISAEHKPIDSCGDALHIGFWIGDDQVKRSAAN